MKSKSDSDDIYVVKVEKKAKKMKESDRKEMKTAGIATELKKAEKEMGKAKLPKVKPMKKGC